MKRNKLTTVFTYQTKYFSHIIYEEKEAREVFAHKPVQAIIRDTSMVISICLYSFATSWKYWSIMKLDQYCIQNFIVTYYVSCTWIRKSGLAINYLEKHSRLLLNNNCILKHFTSVQNRPMKILITLHNPLKTFSKWKPFFLSMRNKPSAVLVGGKSPSLECSVKQKAIRNEIVSVFSSLMTH